MINCKVLLGAMMLTRGRSKEGFFFGGGGVGGMGSCVTYSKHPHFRNYFFQGQLE